MHDIIWRIILFWCLFAFLWNFYRIEGVRLVSGPVSIYITVHLFIVFNWLRLLILLIDQAQIFLLSQLHNLYVLHLNQCNLSPKSFLPCSATLSLFALEFYRHVSISKQEIEVHAEIAAKEGQERYIKGRLAVHTTIVARWEAHKIVKKC